MSNIPIVIEVAKRMGPLRKQLVFVGGSIVELLLDKDYPLPPRVTYDVDTIVEVYRYGDFAKIEESLRAQGFSNDHASNVICRWHIDGFIIDVMPTDSRILGFSNHWYADAVKNAQKHKLSSDLSILLISAPYFIATKLEAFEARGNEDYLGSHDLEDVITVLDGRESIVNDITNSDKDLRTYLSRKIKHYQNNTHFMNSIPGHLSPYQAVVDQRVKRIEKIFKAII